MEAAAISYMLDGKGYRYSAYICFENNRRFFMEQADIFLMYAKFPRSTEPIYAGDKPRWPKCSAKELKSLLLTSKLAYFMIFSAMETNLIIFSSGTVISMSGTDRSHGANVSYIRLTSAS